MDHLGFDARDRHAANVARLRPTDIVAYGYPGSGATLLGNLLQESGLAYFDPYTETLDAGRTIVSAEARRTYRTRLAATAQADQAGPRDVGQDRLWVKTHCGPDVFPVVPTAVVILVRDPRDAVRSSYEFRRRFGRDRETRSFEEFLQHGPEGAPAAAGWARLHEEWLGRAASDAIVVRFEDLKGDMPVTFSDLVRRAMSVELDCETVARACARSSFSSMRAHEDAVAGDDRRVMRRGQIGEWREWWSFERAPTFLTPQVTAMAERLGYRIEAP